MMKKILIIALFITFPNVSYAYLDPGMGSYILAMLAAFFATLITFFSVFIQKFKIFLNKIKSFLKKKK
tara:strand:+ start:1063 stop:1266 length:204 start_codon:yes stop_codon:yes gene_type:complete